MKHTLVLDDTEANFLVDVLHNWLAGVEDARPLTQSDTRTLESFEDLLEAMAGLDEQERLVNNMLAQLPRKE